jgi:ornithine cyclodeaminase
MKLIDRRKVAALASYRDIVEALRQGFRGEVETPVRHHHEISDKATLLLMPAWSSAYTGLKTVVVKSDNAARNLPTVQASYLLIDNSTGATVAMIDGTELTRRRTAAAAALAADYLARADAAVMTLVGAGALGPHFARAHAAVRPIRRIFVFNRTPEKARSLASELTAEGFEAEAVETLEPAIRQSDIVSCITTSTVPVVRGAWLKPGTHLDLAGAFRPTMRETDAEAVAKSSVYVDTREGAVAEAGDLIQAAAEGKFDFSLVRADLFELCRGTAKGRAGPGEITLFKSCGTALEDLAAAILLYERA